MTLSRLVLDYRSGEIVVRCLYRSTPDAPNPGTKARAREVTDLVRTGLQGALDALDSEAGVDMVGTSGYELREDVILAATSSAEAKQKAKLVRGEKT